MAFKIAPIYHSCFEIDGEGKPDQTEGGVGGMANEGGEGGEGGGGNKEGEVEGDAITSSMTAQKRG